MKYFSLPVSLTAVLLLVSGCSQEPAAPPANVAEEHGHEHAHGHEHGEHGPHDGQLLELGGGKYHAEVVHDDASKQVTVYLLGEDVKTATPIEEESLVISAMLEGKPQRFVLNAKPLEGEPEGQSSRYEATDAALVTALDTPESKPSLSVTIAGRPYEVSIKPHDHEHGHEHEHK